MGRILRDKKHEVFFTENKDNGIFAEGICFKKLLFIFVIGSVLGTYYEQILNLIVNYLKNGSIIWESRRGLIYGPLSPIYGAGFVMMVVLFKKRNYRWYELILYGALFGGTFEYIISFLQETFIGTISWDYTDKFLNINGRTTILFMLIWGLFCFFIIKRLYPFFSGLVEKIPIMIGNIIFKFLIVFLAFDVFISFGALFRQTLRREKVPSKTPVGKFFDDNYTDEYLKTFYTNMKVSDRR